MFYEQTTQNQYYKINDVIKKNLIEKQFYNKIKKKTLLAILKVYLLPGIFFILRSLLKKTKKFSFRAQLITNNKTLFSH